MESKQSVCILLTLLFVQGADVHGVEFDYGITASLEKHSNINLLNDPDEDELVRSLKLDFRLSESSAFVIANLDASVESRDYQYNLQEDENIGRLSASSLFIIEPRKFEWFLSDVYTQTISNPLEADTPDNRQNTNLIASGPNIIFRLNSHNLLNLQARYIDVDYEDDLLNNKREQVALRWNYNFASYLETALNYENMDITFDQSSLGKLKKEDAFLSAEYRLGRNEITIEAGATIVTEKTGDEIDEERYKLSLISQRSSSSSIGVGVTHVLTDNSLSILDTIIGRDMPDLETFTAESDIYINDSVEISYQKTWGINSLDIYLADTKLDYRSRDNYDSDERLVRISTSWGLSSNTFVDIYGQKSVSEYLNLIPYREDNDYLTGLRFRYSSSRNLNYYLEIESHERESTLQINDYKDNKILLSLEYRSL